MKTSKIKYKAELMGTTTRTSNTCHSTVLTHVFVVSWFMQSVDVCHWSNVFFLYRCCCTYCSSMQQDMRCLPSRRWRRLACCCLRWVLKVFSLLCPGLKCSPQCSTYNVCVFSGWGECAEHWEVQQHGKPGCLLPFQVCPGCPGEHECNLWRWVCFSRFW